MAATARRASKAAAAVFPRAVFELTSTSYADLLRRWWYQTRRIAGGNDCDLHLPTPENFNPSAVIAGANINSPALRSSRPS